MGWDYNATLCYCKILSELNMNVLKRVKTFLEMWRHLLVINITYNGEQIVSPLL